MKKPTCAFCGKRCYHIHSFEARQYCTERCKQLHQDYVAKSRARTLANNKDL